MNGWRGSSGSPHGRARRGNAAVVALSLSAMLGFGALSVDIAMQRVTDAQVQTAIEAAALGGAGYLDRTISSMKMAKTRAVALANANNDQILGGWELQPEDVEVGIWDGTDFTPVNPDDEDLEPGDDTVMAVNAIRIETSHSTIPAVLSGYAFGRSKLETNNRALGVRQANRGRAVSVPCFLPLAIPDCSFTDWTDGVNTTTNPDPIKFIMSNSNIDNAGWADPFSSAFGSGDIIDGFAGGGCHDDDIEIGENMHVKNGQNTTVVEFIGTVLNRTDDEVFPENWNHNIADRPDRDGTSANCPRGEFLSEETGACDKPNGPKNIGSVVTDKNWDDHEPVIQGPVALVSPPNCEDNTSFTGTMPISGFAWAMIYDAQTHATKTKDAIEEESKNIWVQLDFIQPHDFGGETDDDPNGNIRGLDQPMLVNY